MSAGELGTNWSGNYAYRATALRVPRTIGELQELVAGARAVRPLGSRHSFTGIADSAELIALDHLPGAISVDHAGATVSVPGHTTYAELATTLNREGVALQNMASLPHISVAGAVATATHGSGNAKGNLATSVQKLQMVTAAGELLTADPGTPEFEGMVVGLGALGVVTRLTLVVEPYYEMRQRVYLGLGWEALFENFATICPTSCSALPPPP
jgi:xylitol oxidase